MKKVAVISGGTDGLGKVIAQILSRDFEVVILARDEKKVSHVAKELHCFGLVCDVSDSKQIENTVRTIREKYGHIDVLINNAGTWIEGELDTNSFEQIDAIVNINTKGAIYLTKAVIPQMKTQKSGTIVNIISVVGLIAKAERSVYSLSKWALTGFTKSMQIELAKYGIRVVGIYPGKMNTKMFEKIGINKDMSNAVNPKDVAKTIEFIIKLPAETIVTDLVIKHIHDQ